MGKTTRGMPYPELSDTPDVPRDIRALAEAADVLAGKVAALEQGPVEPSWNVDWFRPYGNGFDVPRVYRVGKMVSLSGLLQMHRNAVFPAGGVMGTLPAGFRPAGTAILRVIYNESAAWVRMNVYADGRITSEAAFNPGYLSLHHTWMVP